MKDLNLKLNIDELSNGFSKLVRSINTRNSKWKIEIGGIDWCIRDFLNNEVLYRHIIDYDLKVERIGQSLIKCDIRYFETYYGEQKTISLKERVKTPNEICNTFLYDFENAIIEKVNRERNCGKISGIMNKVR